MLTPTQNDELDALALRLDREAGVRALRAVHDFLGRFVAYPSPEAHVAHTLWCAHAHGMDRWDSTPRIAFLSPEPGSGKTRALEVTELLVPRPVLAVNVSPAYLFRRVADEHGPPTILYDEIDTLFGPHAQKNNEDVRGFLNAGHRRGAVAGRCVLRGKTIVTEELPAYAAVALAGLGAEYLPDTIRTRSVIIPMRRRRPDEHVSPFRRRDVEAEGAALGMSLAAWARTWPRRIDWPDMPAGIQDRDADCWEPLIAVADLAGGDWPRLARAAAVALVGAAKDSTPSLGIRLLADLRDVFGSADELPSQTIVERLCAMDEAPWADLRGRPLDARQLARRLGQYGIRSALIRFGARPARGYRRADLADAWARYLPALSPDTVTSVTSVTPRVPTVTSVTLGNRKTSTKSMPVTAVTAVTAPAGMARGGAPHVTLAPADVTLAPADVTDAPRTCAHCGRAGGDMIQLYDGAHDHPIWLHRACEPLWTCA